MRYGLLLDARAMPHLPRLEARRENGMEAAWLLHEAPVTLFIGKPFGGAGGGPTAVAVVRTDGCADTPPMAVSAIAISSK